ncbi:hypothetical protein [Aliivibrio finisterrensis]|uniref:Uncharacterized protein n=1 Tax=Aliivibrio finisterrensis TaxID=511998 RepID=A0A6N6RPH0_9GAMM|nr:hypothetical protein [Aliivibrio finisterrensis]KAB2823371.1 hypothetical protein F8B77_15855 [Aliivibrio finisterrensis]
MSKISDFFDLAAETLATFDKSIDDAKERQKCEHEAEILKILKNYNDKNKTNFSSLDELESHLDSSLIALKDKFIKLGLN